MFESAYLTPKTLKPRIQLNKLTEMSVTISLAEYNELYVKRLAPLGGLSDAGIGVVFSYLVSMVYFFVGVQLPRSIQVALLTWIICVPIFVALVFSHRSRKYDKLVLLIPQCEKEVRELRTKYTELIKKYNDLIEEIGGDETSQEQNLPN